MAENINRLDGRIERIWQAIYVINERLEALEPEEPDCTPGTPDHFEVGQVWKYGAIYYVVIGFVSDTTAVLAYQSPTDDRYKFTTMSAKMTTHLPYFQFVG